MYTLDHWISKWRDWILHVAHDAATVQEVPLGLDAFQSKKPMPAPRSAAQTAIVAKPKIQPPTKVAVKTAPKKKTAGTAARQLYHKVHWIDELGDTQQILLSTLLGVGAGAWVYVLAAIDFYLVR